ncbi:Putative NMT1/THI5 like domain protein [Corynebacterium glyciniphilum AJ 3170]|uniref:Thiamine pyrimidine synthase n=1 Tax=Corynebacterium glyciniphilum AJ 3170 TaxID=1404245 RepID=X5DVF4_9CORY|nr:ABC transporter substrate-binding protein [Corynebacterium glyciniphilum]AHW64637.1 Putative NMT1/THI5 like domain protein [Corynebacterium glyciniphilum AJ 3170]
MTFTRRPPGADDASTLAVGPAMRRHGTARRTSTVLTAVLAVTALVLSGCALRGLDDDALRIQLAFVKNSQNAGEYIADHDGYYRDAGFSKVDLIAGPTAVEQSAATGHATVAGSTALGTANAIDSEGMPIKIIGAIYARNAFTIISMNGPSAIRTPADLEGARIAVTPGTAQSMVEGLARANDIDPSTITFVPAGETAVLTSGEVDGFHGLTANQLIDLQRAGHDVVSLDLADHGMPFAGAAYAVSQESIDGNRENLKKFLEASIRGWREAIDDPRRGAELATDIYGADLGLDPEKELLQAEAQIEFIDNDQTAPGELFRLTDDAMAENVESLRLSGIDVSTDELFDMSLLDEVYEENPDLRDPVPADPKDAA